MMRDIVILVFLLGYQAIGAYSSSECRCSLSEKILRCDRRSVRQIPDDILINCPHLPKETVEGFDLQDQEVTRLSANAFANFPSLVSIQLSFNQIKTIESGAFDGLDQLTSIFLSHNQIETLQDGVFDGPSLKKLDLSYNPVANYTTRTWTFCHELEFGTGRAEGIQVFQDFSTEDKFGGDYCNRWNLFHVPEHHKCLETTNGSVLDCSSQSDNLDILGLGCGMLDTTKYQSVKVNFPKDKVPMSAASFGVGASAPFFKDFNVASSFNRMRRKLTFYGTIFDLASLPDNTNFSLTEEVTVQADTVVISRPITIDYKLKIRARQVILSQPLTMVMNANDFSRQGRLRAQYEKSVLFGSSTTVRHRQFGLVDIVDKHGRPEDKVCQPLTLNADEVDTSDAWFDPILVNLMYVCASTVQPDNNKLAMDITHHNLEYYSDKRVVGDAFSTAQKFQRVEQLGQYVKAHDVPVYNLKTISDLSQIMHDKLNLYLTLENRQQDQLTHTMGRIQEMKEKFDIVQIQQENYFQTEQTIQDGIFGAVNNSWVWSFEHRKTSDEAIFKAFDSTGKLIGNLQKEHMQVMLDQAQESVTHYQDAVHKYNEEIQRYKAIFESSNKRVKVFFQQFEHETQVMNIEEEKFEASVQKYEQGQIFREIFGFIKCFVNIFKGIASGDSSAVISGVKDFAKIAKEMYKVIKEVNKIMKLVDELDIEQFNDLTVHPTTKFMDALKEANQLKMKGPKFQELKAMAVNKIKLVDKKTNGKVKSEDFVTACVQVSNLGEDLIHQVSDLASTLLTMAERQDDLAMAQTDLQRATQQVEAIHEALHHLNDSSSDYQKQMKQVQKEYEDEVQKMHDQYEHVTTDLRHQYQQKITEKFQAFQQKYTMMKSSYTQSLSLLADSSADKLYGLQTASMTQRSMLTLLFGDYCDAIFYHAFKPCSKADIPLLGEDMPVLLNKVLDLQWDAIINRFLPVAQIPFSNTLTVSSKGKYDGNPLALLRNGSKMSINLKDYIPASEFGHQWRWRIDTLRVLLLDDDSQVIPSKGTGFGNDISVQIAFPQVFNDTDSNLNVYTFLAQPFYCRSTYETPGGIKYTEDCKATDDFSSNYKASPDGNYVFKLLSDNSTLDVDKVSSLKIELKGTYIPILSAAAANTQQMARNEALSPRPFSHGN